MRRFNRLYGEVLVEPQALLSDTPLIPGSDGRKMSKSLDNAIELDDEPDAIRAKVRSFITDPQKVRRGDPGRPEICPDLRACTASSRPSDRRVIEAGCRTGELGCVDCKTILADHLIEQLAPFRERRAELAANPGYVDRRARRRRRAGAADRRRRTMAAVRNAMHFGWERRERRVARADAGGASRSSSRSSRGRSGCSPS